MRTPNAQPRAADRRDEFLEILIPLEEAADRPVAEVGGKAKTLGRLLRDGFPVPDGFVVMAAARCMEEAGAASDPQQMETQIPTVGREARSATDRPSVPQPVRDALGSALRSLGASATVAVRSSAGSEDGARSSYAGQFRTELHVEGIDQLEDAVRRCWAAGEAEHVRTYRASREEAPADGGEGPALALVVQRMVPADAAGVAFTADPRTGRRDAVVIEAVTGTGDALVSGERTPERWRVTDGAAERDGGAERGGGAERVLEPRLAAEVARLARRVEEALSGPQDIEWAVAEGELHLLQARPITAGAEPSLDPVPADVPETGFWFRDEAHFPRPFHPLFSSIYVAPYREAVSGAFEEFGILVDGLEIREIGGWPYSRILPPGGGKDGPAPPRWLLWLVSRVAPPLRRKRRRARRALRDDLAERYLTRWWEEWRPELAEWIRRKDAVDLPSLSRAELAAHYREAVEAFARGLRIHFRLFPPFCLAVTELVFFCRDELGWAKERAIELLAGVSEASSEPGRALDVLARAAAERDDVRDALDGPGPDTLARLESTAPDFGREFRKYQERYGLRVLHYDFGTPTFRERPELVLGFLRNQMRRVAESHAAEAEVVERRRSRIHAARESLHDRPQALQRFETVLERAHRAYPAREDNEFFALSVLGVARYAALEAGRRMESAGHLERAEQVFFLRDAELRGWLHEPEDLRAAANERESLHRRAERNPGPPAYGEDPGPPPDPSPLPPEVRTVTRALLWMVDNDLQTPSPEAEGIAGVGASPGRYTGPARIVRSEEEFEKVRPGDVLVCPITSPTWSALFPSIGALVTDAGGLLSHPAIIAREFGVPAVLATGTATSELRDDQRVTVDGTAGRVEPG